MINLHSHSRTRETLVKVVAEDSVKLTISEEFTLAILNN